MPRRRATVPVRLATAAAILSTLLLAGCSGYSRTIVCDGATCTVTAQGAQTIQREFENGVPWVMEIGPVRDGRTTVAFQGEQATLGAGETAVLAGYTVAVKSVEGDTVQVTLS